MSDYSSPSDEATRLAQARLAQARLARTLERIDAANADDPVSEQDDDGQLQPRALLYGRRMSAQLERFAPDASTELRIAARAQHIQRWTIPRSDYPMDRQGYHRWRRTLAGFHAERTGAIMTETGYPPETIARVQSLLRKENLQRNPETRTLEDVICLVFLSHYLVDFAQPHDDEKVVGILQRTWGKMSPHGQKAALTLALHPEVERLVGLALADPA